MLQARAQICIMRGMALITEVTEVAWHRNGISGEGFNVVRFLGDVEGSGKPKNFLAVLFDGQGQCAVICLDLIESCGVAFARGNSWRGDCYEEALREAIATMDSSGSVRVGPFGIPT